MSVPVYTPLAKKRNRMPKIGRMLYHWLDEYGPQMKHASKLRAQCYVNNELAYFKDLHPTSLTPGIVWEYVLMQIAEGKKPGTIAGGLRYLSRALSLLWSGYLSAFTWQPPNERRGPSPALMVMEMAKRCRKKYRHLDGKGEAFTPEEKALVRRVAAEVEPAWADFLELAFLTGMRRSELRALQWDCVDLEAGVIELRRNFSVDELGTPKTDTPRTVHLSPGAIAMLRRMKDAAAPDVQWVFHNAGSFWRQADVGHAMHRIIGAAEARGMRPGLSLHSCRRTYVSQGREHMSDAWMQKQVGHSAAMQQIYTRAEATLPPELDWADD